MRTVPSSPGSGMSTPFSRMHWANFNCASARSTGAEAEAEAVVLGVSHAGDARGGRSRAAPCQQQRYGE
ncbi:hypothetical protein ACFQX6_47915 [Streptosporangium lutulentum]